MWIPEARTDDRHLVMPSGDDLIGGPAGIALLIELKPTRWLGRLARTLRAGPIVSLTSDVLKRLRPRLGRLVIDAPGPVRYP